MNRIVYIHWSADEAEAPADLLRRAGHDVRTHSDSDSSTFRDFRTDPPDAFVVDLGRIPSQGRAVGTWLRRQKATRNAALVFVEGESEKTDVARRQFPDATFTSRGRIRGAVRRAIAARPATPIVPGTMNAYSGTPLPKKLGVKAGTRGLLLSAPKDFERELGPLPEGARFRRRLGTSRGETDLVLLFAKSRADMERRLPDAIPALAPGGSIWIAWRKKASGAKTDLTQAAVRGFGLDSGLVDYKICSIDATWSGLRFARRR